MGGRVALRHQRVQLPARTLRIHWVSPRLRLSVYVLPLSTAVTRNVLSLLRAAVCVSVLTVPTVGFAQAEIPPTYTDSQATRGGQWFAARCQSCHPSRDMASPDFKVRWGGLRALDLYTIISTTMPQNEPGTLSRRAYADIVAYLMQINGLQAGSTPLASDSTALAATRLSFASNPSSTR